MSGKTHREWAEVLHRAYRDRAPIDPLTSTDPRLTVEDAYAIQQELAQLLLAEGGEIIGYKLGLTSKPMQEMLGVDQPDFGPVMSSTTHRDGVVLDVERFIQPRIEAELALVLGRALRGPGVTRGDAAATVTGARAALEVIDSRIRDWKIGLVDTVADLASTGAVVLGDETVATNGWEPRLCGMAIYRNGELQATGAGAAALGDPLGAVAWLANTLGALGTALDPGHVVMTGSLHAALPVAPGDVVRAEFDRLGEVSARFTGRAK